MLLYRKREAGHFSLVRVQKQEQLKKDFKHLDKQDGRNLQNLIESKNIPWDGVGNVESMWQRLSATWAKGVPNGSSVPVFLNNPRAGAIWFNTELPILTQKGVNIIYK